jgi:Leucine-rich repeat (LRR) protein
MLWLGTAGVASATGCGARSGLNGASLDAGSAGTPDGRGGGARAGFGGSAGAAAGRSGGAGMAGTEACGPLIDDLESGTGRICRGEGRVGVWYAFNDEAGSQSPALTTPGTPIFPSAIPGGRGASALAMHTHGEGFTLWGAGVGLDLSFDGVTYGRYDARARGYDGVTFWARGIPAPRVSFRISTSATTLATYGGVCEREPCSPFAIPLNFGAEWTQYWVPFDALPSGNPALETDQLTNMQFLTDPNGQPFDFWIDDISFYFGAPGCCPSGCEGTLAFADPALETAVRSALVEPTETLRCEDSCTLHHLVAAPNGIRDLDGLECLAGLMTLNVAQNQVSELRPLAPLKNLTTLNLAQNEVIDLSSLANLTNVTSLELGQNQIVDVTALAGMRALTLLDLSENQIVDVAALSNLSAVSTLNLSNNRLEEVPQFPDSSLKILLLMSNQLGDVGALSSLEHLTQLNVQENRIGSIRVPFSLPELTTFVASMNQLTDISGLSGAPLLSSLFLSQNRVTDVSSLAGLRALRTLDLSQNPLADVGPLSGLDLGTLNLSQTQVSDLSALRGMTNLRYVQLSDTPVADLGPLSGATLYDLYLSRARVRDVSPLSSVTFQNVTFERGGRSGVLDLSENQLTDLGPLAMNPAIPSGFHVVVSSNPIDCSLQAENIASLRNRGVGVDVDCP